MPDDMQQAAFGYAANALQGLMSEKEIASYLAKAFEADYKLKWRCVVGRQGGYVPPPPKYFIFFYIGQVAILLYTDE
jgi:dynein light chain LC8-type